MTGTFYINNEEKILTFEGGDILLNTLRKNGYSEVKNGCHEGECGACMILLDGMPVNSCKIFTAAVIEKKITTVGGLGSIHEPHLIQKAFVEMGAVQCGYCTPAFVLTTHALLNSKPLPTDEEIKDALDGILCRCTGYVKIIDAVKLAAQKINAHE
ncbi:MAG: (2Fe-2S)-binding protein [Bacteroidales bacterium]|nr:(2Fe-2S)-binding protein [Bacteroidales bacterium]